MNTVDRNRLLMEMFGINCGKQAKALSDRLKNSPLYIDSKIKLKQASLSSLPSAVKDYVSLRDLDFSAYTMADYASLETHVLEYSLHSLPIWWSNPMEKEKAKDSPLSIGSLLVEYKDKYITIDELLQTEDISFQDKKDILENRVNGWESDERLKIINAVKEVNSRKGGTSSFVRGLMNFLSVLLLFFANAFSIYLFSNGLLQPFITAPDATYLSTYALYLPLAVTIAYDFFFAIYMAIQSRRNQGIDYVRNFSKKKLVKIQKDLSVLVGRMMDYLLEHAKNKTPLHKDSMSMFVFKDSDKAKGILSVSRENTHWILDAVFITVGWLVTFVMVFALIIVIINFQKGIAI